MAEFRSSVLFFLLRRELNPVVRSYSEEGWSNPKKILDRMQLNITEAESGVVSYESLLNWIMDYLSDEGVIYNNRTASAYVWQILKDICTNQLQVNLSDQVSDMGPVCSQILDALKTETQWDNIVKDVPAVIEDRAITFDKNLDKICFIIDRDKDSFVSKEGNDHYAYVLKMCKENGYGFYLSNPCFEFWLLMHFDEVFELDRELLLDHGIRWNSFLEVLAKR